jgi:hypothetical protein
MATFYFVSIVIRALRENLLAFLIGQNIRYKSLMLQDKKTSLYRHPSWSHGARCGISVTHLELPNDV